MPIEALEIPDLFYELRAQTTYSKLAKCALFWVEDFASRVTQTPLYLEYPLSYKHLQYYRNKLMNQLQNVKVR